MQLTKFLPLAFAATALASPFAKRDAATVVSDIGVVGEKVTALNDSITAFQGGNEGLIQALQVQTASDAVKSALNETTTAAKASEPFTSDEAIDIANAVNTLSPNVISTLDNLKGKKAAFDSGFVPLSAIVASSLKAQKQGTVDLTAAIKEKVPEELRDAAQQFVQPILDKFDEVIAVYSSGGGSPTFPTGFPSSGGGFPTSFPTGFPSFPKA